MRGTRRLFDGTFDADTEAATWAFQVAKWGTGNGIVDQATMFALDDVFDDHARDAAIAKGATAKRKPKVGKEFAFGKAPKELLAGTQAIDEDEKAEAQALLTPSEAMRLAGCCRSSRRTWAVVNEVIDLQFETLAKGKAADHADPSKLHDMKDIASLAQPAQMATDAVFGSYARGVAIAPGTLVDRWADAERQIGELEKRRAAGGKDGAKASDSLDGMVTWRVQKIVNESAAVRDLNERHGAVMSRSVEKAFVQSSDAAGNRAFMWQQFRTMIHEYLHTLCHSRYDKHAQRHPDPARGHALREGMIDFLTKIVWGTIKHR